MYCERGYDVSQTKAERLRNMFVCGAEGKWLGYESQVSSIVPNCIGRYLSSSHLYWAFYTDVGVTY